VDRLPLLSCSLCRPGDRIESTCGARVRKWPSCEVVASAINVGLQKKCGLELLNVSSSQFGPEPTFAHSRTWSGIAGDCGRANYLKTLYPSGEQFVGHFSNTTYVRPPRSSIQGGLCFHELGDYHLGAA